MVMARSLKECEIMEKKRLRINSTAKMLAKNPFAYMYRDKSVLYVCRDKFC